MRRTRELTGHDGNKQLLKRLKLLTGVVEVGLFCGLAKAAYFGNQDGSVTGRFADGSVQTFAAAQ